MNRKKFLINSGLTVVGLSTLGFIKKDAKGAFIGDCQTTNDILGPFFRPDAPLRSDLTYEGITGSIIEIKGTVFENDCITPIEDALIEIWHCDSDGNYDNDSEEFRHRASFMTLADGVYSFKTIIPGKYLNGALYRPSHIHFRVTAKNHPELISQIYFQGDPHIEKDPWASSAKAIHRVLPVAPINITGNLNVRFDINLG